MKKVLFIFALIFTASISAQEIKWMSMEDALTAQAKNPKKIFVDMYTNWCGPCKLLDRNTFSNADVANYINKHYYAVKFNAEGNDVVNYQNNTFTNAKYDPAKANRRNSQHAFATHMGIQAYPTVLFLDEEGNLINRVKSYKTPQQLELYLKLFGTDKWKELTTQESFDAYFAAFKPQFKG